MANNTVRTIVIFGLIALVLGAAAVGGIRLMKVRNSSYAATQTQAQTTPPQEQQKPEETKKEPQPAQQGAQNSSPSTPAPAAKPSSQGGTPTAVTETGATPGGSMPATGPTEFFATLGMLMLAVFFGAKILRARADYRRYVGS